jgi:transposase
MGRHLEVEWRHTAKRLFILYNRERDWRTRTRLQALMLLRQKKGVADVAATVGVAPRTVLRWVAWYRADGLEAVHQHRVGGHGQPARRLSPAQEATLKAKAARGEIRSVQDGRAWAAQEHVDYSYSGMRWVFLRLGLTKKVPRPRNPNASPAAQTAWKKGGSRAR